MEKHSPTVMICKLVNGELTREEFEAVLDAFEDPNCMAEYQNILEEYFDSLCKVEITNRINNQV
ncbi:hypothetical protein MM213_17310 [Belliella sp. R4-6]|uniref:Uncharacterized protein n=1 Tax=Belliella alkalica TaxID=1730871 RepID=A0ABS9VFP1_9BACT|nr:hypothetical protein [Belliella alkalica]MCH7415262.1 hypothetical protein [Belliella alkalica]